MRPVPLRIALLLSTRYFEDFYGRELGIEHEEYVQGYRNDWSWDWCAMLRDEGIDASIYVPSLARKGAHRTPEGYEVRFLPLAQAYAPFLRFPVLERTPVGRYAGQAANAASFLRALRAGLAADSIDALCVQEYWTARFDLLAASLELPLLTVDQGLPDRREVKLLKRRTFPQAARVITQTETERSKVAAYGARAVTIPNAVDADYFTPGPPAGAPAAPTILCTARLHDTQKKISEVIRALPHLPGSWSLDLVGTGPDAGDLAALAADLGVSGRIRFHGFVGSKETLRELYRSCTVFALPSAYEGLPMSLLEAMACGAAVVGSDIPAITRVVEDGLSGVIATIGRPADLAAAVEKAAGRSEALGRHARSAVESRFSREAVGPVLAGCFREAVGA